METDRVPEVDTGEEMMINNKTDKCTVRKIEYTENRKGELSKKM